MSADYPLAHTAGPIRVTTLTETYRAQHRPEEPTVNSSVLADLIADVLHYATMHGLDAEAILTTAQAHYTEEQADAANTTPGAWTATFNAQAWVGDNAVPVDPDGDTTWPVSARFDTHIHDALTAKTDLDFLQDDLAAPTWVRTWHGPFTITVSVSGEVTS